MPDLFQLLDREAWIITAADGPRKGGLVATWVQPSSLDPAEPLVTISISTNHFTRELIDASGAFGLHLLADDQTDLAFNFCIGSGRERDKLASVDWQPGTLGMPMLIDCVAGAECRVVDRIETAGRVLYIADIVESRVNRDAPILREKALLQAATPAQRAALLADRDADIEIMREAIQRWRERADGVLD